MAATHIIHLPIILIIVQKLIQAAVRVVAAATAAHTIINLKAAIAATAAQIVISAGAITSITVVT